MASRTAYTGTYRKLVLAFDIGNTYSSVSYSILDPGQVPEIRRVKRFPAQDQVGGDSKIPTILHYDRSGSAHICATGAKAVLNYRAEDEGWTKVEWFNLHLRPKSQSTAQFTNKIPPLPLNKSIVDIFADFLKYLFDGTRTYIQKTHSNGPKLWRSLEKDIEFVLTHPNGWEGHQQSQMRRAAVLAGFIPDTAEGQSRLSFVTEGEASLHYCLQIGLIKDTMKKSDDGVLIVDAGRETIDISAYGLSSGTSTELAFDEIAPPQCHFQGSIFVTHRARVFLENRLRNSKFVVDVDHITRRFDKSTKLRFRSDSEPQFIKFGPPRLRDAVLNIRSGQLRLMGAEVATFFEPSVTCIVQAVLSQRANAKKNISSVFLVGGFAASDWLFKKLKDELEPLGLDICRPDSNMNKTVADGAVSFYLNEERPRERKTWCPTTSNITNPLQQDCP